MIMMMRKKEKDKALAEEFDTKLKDIGKWISLAGVILTKKVGWLGCEHAEKQFGGRTHSIARP